MIKSKLDYKRYLQRDALALFKIGIKRPRMFTDHVWRFERLMRKLEYYKTFGRFKRLLMFPVILFNRYRYNRMGMMLGLSVPLGVFDEGLSIVHYGCLVVSSFSKIGKNCRIHEGVTIGATNGSEKAPQIGDNVFIGTGAKIIGDITIADNVAIGANSVVVKSITEEGTTWAGIPAKKISDNDSRSNLSKYLFMES